MSDGVSHISGGRRKTKHVSILTGMRIIPTTTTTTMIVKNNKRLDLNLFSTRRRSRHEKVCRHSSTCKVRAGQHIHYTIASVAGRSTSDRPNCSDLISLLKVKNGQARDTTLVGRLSTLDLEKGTPSSNKQTTRRRLMWTSVRWVSWEAKVLKDRTNFSDRSRDRLFHKYTYLYA